MTICMRMRGGGEVSLPVQGSIVRIAEIILGQFPEERRNRLATRFTLVRSEESGSRRDIAATAVHLDFSRESGHVERVVAALQALGVRDAEPFTLRKDFFVPVHQFFAARNRGKYPDRAAVGRSVIMH